MFGGHPNGSLYPVGEINSEERSDKYHR